jgi:nucleoid DNA-binding protein
MAENKAAKAKGMTKSEIFTKLAEATDMTRKEVAAFFEELTKLIKNEVGKKGPGTFVLPGLLKIRRVEKPPTKARMGRNPQTGEQIMIKAKPKSTVIRARPLKALKDIVK